MKLNQILKKANNWRDIYSVLIKYNKPNGPTGGLLFEEFCKYYFLCEPSVKEDYVHVWLYSEVPSQVRKKLDLGRKDYGIDLILEDRHGRYFSVQCKFKTDENSRLSWSHDKLANFLAQSDEVHGLIIFTNATGIDKETERKASKKSFFSIFDSSDLIKLDKETIQKIIYCSKGKKPKRVKKAKPYDFQKRAIQKVSQGFKKEDRGQLILPCGSGKTLTALWIKETLKPKLTLVLVPSLALLKQTKEEWNKHQKEWGEYLCVCSEQEIDRAQGEDRIVTHTYEIHGRVTTNPKDIKQFLKQGGSKVIYSTYQSLNKIEQAIKNTSIKFDLAICDEAHRTSGVKTKAFALVHDDKRLPVKKRLYMTATPRIVSEQAKNKLGDEYQKLLADMSDPKIFGREFHRMSFAEAIDKNILADYQIIGIGVSDQEIKKAIEERRFIEGGTTIDEVAHNYALQKVMEKFKAKHSITFHSSIKGAKEFTERHNKIFPKTSSFHVNGTLPTSQRALILDNFITNNKSIVTNARCLTEGVDLPAVDSVYFCDPRSSKIEIIQATGRALRKPKDFIKKFGYVVVPIFHSERENIDKKIESSPFKQLVSVVRALSDQDERLQQEINLLRFGKGKRKISIRNLRIEADGVELVHLEGFEEKLKSAFFDQIIQKATTLWEVMVTQLKKYKKKYGHCRVPEQANAPLKELGEWVYAVRLLKRRKGRGKLAEEQVSELNSYGFDWKFEGETLPSTEGLLHEAKFRKKSGLSRIDQYRKEGLITPIGYAMIWGRGVGPYYHPKQIKELKKALGITLKNTKGLLTENQIVKKSGLSGIKKYRKEGLITPVGYALGRGGIRVSPYYYPKQIKELKKTLGITLPNTKGLLNEAQFRKKSGLSGIRRYRKKGLIKPCGKAITSAGLSFFYYPKQIKELKKTLGITLPNTKGLLNEAQFRKKSGLSLVTKYRNEKKITPVGYAMTRRSVCPYYHPRQIKELKKALGITLTNTKGLLNEKQFRKKSGLSLVTKYRNEKKITPVGYAMTGSSGVRPFYHPKEIKKLKKALGITLANTKRLLNEAQFRKKSGLTNIGKYRKKGLIKPCGKAITSAGLSFFYHPKQIKELKKALGITLPNTKGLLNEKQFRKKSRVTKIEIYRKKGLIKPVGYAMTHGAGVTPYYHRRQIEKLGRILRKLKKDKKEIQIKYYD